MKSRQAVSAEEDLRCPLCAGALSIIVGPSRVSFHCALSRPQFVNHGELLENPALPYHRDMEETLGRLQQAWDEKAGQLAKVGARALKDGQRDVADTFGREAEAVATKRLILWRHLAHPEAGPAIPVPPPLRSAPEGKLTLETSALGTRIGLLAIRGPVDYSNASYVDAAIQAFFDKGVRRLVIDLSGGTYLASCAISVLISALDRAEKEGGGIVLAGTSPPVRKVLDLMGLTEVIRSAPDAAIAGEMLKDQRPS